MYEAFSEWPLLWRGCWRDSLCVCVRVQRAGDEERMHFLQLVFQNSRAGQIRPSVLRSTALLLQGLWSNELFKLYIFLDIVKVVKSSEISLYSIYVHVLSSNNTYTAACNLFKVFRLKKGSKEIKQTFFNSLKEVLLLCFMLYSVEVMLLVESAKC